MRYTVALNSYLYTMKKNVVVTVIGILLSLSLYAQQPEVFSTEAGAIQGYDPVAFFKEGKAIPGKKEFTWSWSGADWYFSSAENLSSFQTEPARYAPQYGGYCAYGTAAGHKSPTQPETWTIVNDKLYFNYNPQVKKLWNKNQVGLIKQADKNWPQVKKQ
jgi:YHS domain-containing protein